MNEHRIKEPLDLHKLFRAYRSHDGTGWLFRGQADVSWPLIPKAGRPELNNERDLGRFNAWRQRAVAYGPLPDNDWECLAIAQHYGLATRLLDWSLNPLVATFFAVADRKDTDGAVYCFSPELFVNIEKVHLDACHQVACFLPRAIDERMNRQSGAFTVHPEPARPLEPSELEPPLEGPNLLRILIPAAQKGETQQMLADYGVHYNGIFPDLDGLSRHINWHTAQMIERKKKHQAKAK